MDRVCFYASSASKQHAQLQEFEVVVFEDELSSFGGLVPAAGAPSRAALLADFLTCDVGYPPDFHEEVLRRVKRGDLKEWSGTGNAYTLTLSPDLAHVHCEYEDMDSATFSLQEFERSLELWRRLNER